MRKNIFAKVLALMMLLVILPVMALAADFAVVHGGRLNLREYASSTSRSLGKYNSGTWVSVQGQSVSGWVPVRTMDGKSGYMSGNYLTFAQTGNRVSFATPMAAMSICVRVRRSIIRSLPV